MSGMTSDRLEELRRIAEAATPGPWAVNPFRATVDEMPSMLPICGLLWPTDQRTEEQTLANATHIATFDPTTVIAILDEIERLRRLQQKVQSAAVLAVAAEQVIKAWVMGDYLAPFMDDLETRCWISMGLWRRKPYGRTSSPTTMKAVTAMAVQTLTTDRRNRDRRFRRWVAKASSDELRAKVLEMAALLKEELVHYILTDDPDGEYCIECRTWDGHKRQCWAGRAEAALRAPGGVRRG